MSGSSARQDREVSCECISLLWYPSCGSPRTRHLPDSQLKDRLLATCGDCKSWYVTDTQDSELIPVSWLANDFFLD